MSMGYPASIEWTSGCAGAAIKSIVSQDVNVEATLSGLQSIYILLIITCVCRELKQDSSIL